MHENPQEFRYPIGKAAKLETTKETLPAVEVKNHVLWVNRAFPELPFRIEEGKQTELGMFLTPMPQEGEKTYPLGSSESHGRSGLLGRVVFKDKNKDKDSELYRDVDIKGSGWFRGSFVGQPTLAEGSKESTGILDLAATYHDRDMSEAFHDAGIGVHRVVAIVSLEEIIDGSGQKISIEEVRKRGMISELNKPVLEVRAFGTRSRLADIMDSNPETGNAYLEDAKNLVAQELGIDPEKFSTPEYFRWLAARVGKNLGLMNKNHWYHKYLLMGHNITLDGKFVDLDSVEKLNPKDESYAFNSLASDFSALENALRKTIIKLQRAADPERWEVQEILEIFKKEYEKAKALEHGNK